ncbi:MAG TPA: hypothetical protein G4N96_08125 [Chloroflexi bacterium]|nr:hypothetical protein [Chloroflexota bacterium]
MSTHTPVLSLALQIAAVEAADTRYEFIEPEHLFVGLCKLEGFANTNRLRALGVPETQVELLAAEIDLLMGLFGRFGIKPSTFRYALRQRKGTGTFCPPVSDKDWMMHRSPESRKIFEVAEQIARQSDSSMAAAFHLLAALLNDAQGRLGLWLQSKKVDVPGLRQAAEGTMLPGVAPAKTRNEPSPLVKVESVFTRYSRDLTQLVRQKMLHFSPEYQAAAMDVVKILNRRVKRNPLLLEEDTAAADKIVQSAVWLLVNDKAPAALRNARIIQMDVTAMAENISYQGEFTERVRDFIKEASQEDDLTLFINGIHAIIGSSSVLVDMSAAISALKLALQQEKLRCIGAASLLEFERYIGENADWRNLFTPLEISNSAPVDAVESAEVIKPLRISKTFQRPAELPVSVTPPSLLPTRLLKATEASPIQAPQMALDSRLDALQTRLTRFGLQVHFSAAAMAILRRLEEKSDTFNAEFAARVENPLGGMLLRGEIDYGQNVLVGASGGKLVFQTGAAYSAELHTHQMQMGL